MKLFEFARDERESLIVNSVLAAAMIIAFSVKSSGMSLIVTFVPGVIVAWLCVVYTSQRPLPAPERVLPWYLFGLGIQFLHFAEEFVGRFNEHFPQLMDGSAGYPLDTFVTFNMVWYFIFILAGITFYKGYRVPMIFMWFFVVYGMCGNAIAHTIFAVMHGGYFPGLCTSLIYWVLGPITLVKMLR